MVLSVNRVDWELAAPILKLVRERIFICEWRIPKRIEFDLKDRHATHILVCDDITHEPIGTGRILSNGEISRIAVEKPYRKHGVDKLILQALYKVAHELLLKDVYIYSPLDCVNYFRKCGYAVTGAVFMEAGMPRQRMIRSLSKPASKIYSNNH